MPNLAYLSTYQSTRVGNLSAFFILTIYTHLEPVLHDQNKK